MVKQSNLRKVPVAVATGTSKAGNWLGRLQLSGFTILIMALTVLGIAILAPQLKILIDQRTEIADLQAQVTAQQSTLSELQAQRARWNDPAYLRAQARDRLYYVMPGEVSYLVINDVALPTSKREAASAQVQQTKTNWVAGLLASFLVAGLGNPTPDQVAPTPAPAVQ
jgi:cell division protein FtsB